MDYILISLILRSYGFELIQNLYTREYCVYDYSNNIITPMHIFMYNYFVHHSMYDLQLCENCMDCNNIINCKKSHFYYGNNIYYINYIDNMYNKNYNIQPVNNIDNIGESNIVKPNTTKEDTTKEDTTKEDTTDSDTTKEDTIKEDITKDDTTKPNNINDLIENRLNENNKHRGNRGGRNQKNIISKSNPRPFHRPFPKLNIVPISQSSTSPTTTNQEWKFF